MASEKPKKTKKTNKKKQKPVQAVTAPLPASDSASEPLFEQRLAQAIGLHHQGVEGSASAVQEANAAFERLREEFPGHAIADAYHGSVMALIARDEANPFERMQWAKRGLALLDAAVTAAPSERTIRMLRGKVAFRLPEIFFRRTETAIEDYIVLIGGELNQPSGLDKATYDHLISELGEAYERIGKLKEAAACWKQLVRQSEDSKLRRLAEEKLQSAIGSMSDPEEPAAAQPLEMRDWIGAAICLAGASLVRLVHRDS